MIHDRSPAAFPSRRGFLGGAAASLLASPAVAQRGRSDGGEVDCVVVGAGAAGIAAARRLREAGRSVVLLEAANRIGGRCITETGSFGVPFDRGASLIHNPDTNPVARLGPRNGLDIYPAPSAQRIRIGRRNAREGELEDFLAASVRASRAITEAARRGDTDCARALPKDLGDWQSTIAFAFGPSASAKDLDEVSTVDFSRAAARDTGAFCRQGYGALLARLAAGLPVRLETPVQTIAVRPSRVEAVTARGTLAGRFLIVTASTNVLASGRIKFEGGLPKRTLDAIDKLRLGSFDRIALELPGHPLGLQQDDRMIERSSGPRTAALIANVGGAALTVVEVGGGFGRELAAQGPAAMVEFAVEWLSDLFGADVKKAVRRTQATQWDKDPWTLGAFGAAAPGGAAARRVLMEPFRNRVFFAGDAVHETLWGTVDGAWESGARAAEAVLRRLSGQPEPKSEPAAERPRRRRRR